MRGEDERCGDAVRIKQYLHATDQRLEHEGTYPPALSDCMTTLCTMDTVIPMTDLQCISSALSLIAGPACLEQWLGTEWELDTYDTQNQPLLVF